MARPRQYDDALRRRLLNHASEQLSAAGPPGLSLRTLAAACETTTAAIYTLFGSRDQLLDAVVAEGFARFQGHLDVVARTADARADLLALGLAYRASALADPHFYRVMFSSDLRAGSDNISEPTFGILLDAVARAHPGLAPAPLRAEALRLWALVHGLVSLELYGLLPEGDTSENGAQVFRETLLADAARSGR
ncbi:TetR/AcrR family transcriptional regulator [Ruania alkalisoli]|uniref:TetR/AcrR family transcriptional regulator n=1 Tax=Ruania alkalisoli TaxID=2779775 RepID=A0A7M1SX26_9MICO|nr:TetR/AcrR family transcriptional regulator [Ruania alkalisoli]QOR72105.1 TetR/AcrR family transcriptional regulator [Ruania alkalisoli]